jgi:hypothetical protein
MRPPPAAPAILADEDIRIMPSAGYSATPLARKLGLVPPLTLVAMGAPAGYRAWLGNIPEGVRITTRAGVEPRAVHLFVTRRAVLASRLTSLRARLAQDGFVWVSWPKRSAGVATDVTEDVIRAVALPLGFVDVKVCAVTDVWSGLKLVIRRSERR